MIARIFHSGPCHSGSCHTRSCHSRTWPRAAALALLTLGIGLGGCADMNDNMTLAFADPAKYDLYECKQLESERKNLATRSSELQQLMAKAETGVAGSLVSELAYRNDYIAVRGQTKLAEEAWQRNKCVATPEKPAAPKTASATPANKKRVKPSKPPIPAMPPMPGTSID